MELLDWVVLTLCGYILFKIGEYSYCKYLIIRSVPGPAYEKSKTKIAEESFKCHVEPEKPWPRSETEEVEGKPLVVLSAYGRNHRKEIIIESDHSVIIYMKSYDNGRPWFFIEGKQAYSVSKEFNIELDNLYKEDIDKTKGSFQ